MRRRSKPARSSHRLFAVLALLVAAGLLTTASADAHVFTRTDANDSASRIDLRSVSVSHTSTSVVHKIRTWNSWTPASLEHDSFFVIGINKDSDPGYERCAFIYYTSRLRGQLSNCGSQFIRFLSVAKLNPTTARITIPKAQLGPAYKWFARSIWVGAAPCRNGCNDFAPNTLPDILHDLAPPEVDMETTPLRSWETSVTTEFAFPFSTSDQHSGMESWTIQRRPPGAVSWTKVATGVGGGADAPLVFGEEGTRFQYRVVARDRQGNVGLGPARSVFVPTDDLNIDGSAYENAATVMSSTAFGGSYQETDSFTFTFTPSSGCQTFELVGPANSDWAVSVTVDGVFAGNLNDDDYPGDDRQTLFSSSPCGATTYVFEQFSGTGRFAVDAVMN